MVDYEYQEASDFDGALRNLYDIITLLEFNGAPRPLDLSKAYH